MLLDGLAAIAHARSQRTLSLTLERSAAALIKFDNWRRPRPRTPSVVSRGKFALLRVGSRVEATLLGRSNNVRVSVRISGIPFDFKGTLLTPDEEAGDIP